MIYWANMTPLSRLRSLTVDHLYWKQGMKEGRKSRGADKTNDFFLRLPLPYIVSYWTVCFFISSWSTTVTHTTLRASNIRASIMCSMKNVPIQLIINKQRNLEKKKSCCLFYLRNKGKMTREDECRTSIWRPQQGI